jgi:catechol 2,3-dioxygenase-like lactoylglutathione lyase family enzyme
MSSVPDTSGIHADGGGQQTVGLNLEAVVIPVSDVDRAKAFYVGLGWRLDADVARDGYKLVQITPPGSGCSIQFGTDLTSAAPGSAGDLYLAVSDIEAARGELMTRGAEVSDVFHEQQLGSRFHAVGASDRLAGIASEHKSYGSFASFDDPDGNGWLLQEITTRLPGRVDLATTSFASAGELSNALRRAEAAHGKHEQRIGHEDPDWPDWYADYMIREQAGQELPL